MWQLWFVCMLSLVFFPNPPPPYKYQIVLELLLTILIYYIYPSSKEMSKKKETLQNEIFFSFGGITHKTRVASGAEECATSSTDLFMDNVSYRIITTLIVVTTI